MKNESLVSLSIPILNESLFASSQFSGDLSSVLAILNKASLNLWKMNMLVSSANNIEKCSQKITQKCHFSMKSENREESGNFSKRS